MKNNREYIWKIGAGPLVVCLLAASVGLYCLLMEGAEVRAEAGETVQTEMETESGEWILTAIKAEYAENGEQEISGSAGEDLPQMPYGTKISGITDEGIEIYWKKPEFSDGYEIYRSYEKHGEYEMIYDETHRNVGTYQDTGFDHEKQKVYYRIRSYEYDEQNQKIYSEYTKCLTAEYREYMELSHSVLLLPSGVTRKLESYSGWGNAAGVVWESDNPAVAKVGQDGSVTGISQGECTVSCRMDEQSPALTCTIVVDREPPEPLEQISARYVQTADGCWENPKAEKSGDAVIMMTGDMMCTSAQQKVQDGGTGDYNFNESFTYVKETISEADFAIGNLETLLSSSWPYMREEVYIKNKPNCNAPARYLDALRYAGFDAFAMSNNHNCDGGVQGAIETIEAVDRYQFARTGLFSSEEEPRTLLADINGIKVGFLSYSVTPDPGFNGKDHEWSEEEVSTILNGYSREKAELDMESLRASGAEYVIAYVHWGTKNVFGITDRQEQTARELADLGVDYIVGGHAHLVQKYEELTSGDGKKVPCLYSLGDFHSSINQIPGNRDSVILRIRLHRNVFGEIELAENGYIPCYTFTEYQGMHYVTIPLDSALNGGIKLKKYRKFHERTADEIGAAISEYVPEKRTDWFETAWPEVI